MLVPSSVWRINIDTPEEGKTISMDNADDRWWEQVDLTKLILASNALDRLSEDIKLLPALVALDVGSLVTYCFESQFMYMKYSAWCVSNRLIQWCILLILRARC